MVRSRKARHASDIRLEWPGDGGNGAQRRDVVPDSKLSWSEAPPVDEEHRNEPDEPRRMRLRLRSSASSAVSDSPHVSDAHRVKELEQEIERLRALVRSLGGVP